MFIVQDFVMIFNSGIHIYNLFYIVYVRLHVYGFCSRNKLTRIPSGAPILATQSYTKNPDSPLGKELDLQQEDTLGYIMNTK